MATISVTKDTFEQTITGNDIVLLDFWASWCGPCRMFGPIFEEASEKNADLVFAKVDTEEQQDLAAGLAIMSIPTLMIFRENVLVFSQPGALPAEALENLIEQVRALDMDEVHKAVAAHEAEHAGHDHAEHDHVH
jgi:thioredoxin 1